MHGGGGGVGVRGDGEGEGRKGGLGRAWGNGMVRVDMGAGK